MKEQITVYSKKDCIYCARTKDLLNASDILFREILVDVTDLGVVGELQEKTGMKTFPQIFIGETVLGGFSELKELEQKSGLSQYK